MMNQLVDRVVAGLGILCQQRLQNCDFIQFDVRRFEVQRAPAIAQVFQHRWRQVFPRVERRVIFRAVAVLVHSGQLELRRRAVVVSLKRIGFNIDFRAGEGVT